MPSTKKGNAGYFGPPRMICSQITAGHEMPCQATGKGYVSAERAKAFNGPRKVRGVMRKAPKGGALHPRDERANHIIAMVTAGVEHPFRVVKRQFRHLKTPCRGLAKNRTQLFTLLALGNLFVMRQRLMT